MAGIAEETVKVAGGVIDAMRGSPLAIANIVLNVCFLVFLFYYVSRISSRAEAVVKDFFVAQDKAYEQWGIIVKDTNDLTEKTMHCILPSDALMLLNARPSGLAPTPDRPSAPEPLQPRAQGLQLLPLPPLPQIPLRVHD